MKPSILIVKKDAAVLADTLVKVLGNAVQLHVAANGFDGLYEFRAIRPAVIIIDDDLPDMRGMTVASIIYDSSEGHGHVLVYLIGIQDVLKNAKADFYLGKNFDIGLLCLQIQHDLERSYHVVDVDDGKLKAIEIQNNMLPKPIQTTHFHVNHVFSAYDRLSGDGINYWYSAPNDDAADRLYGYIFDCVGHDLSSYGQVGSMWLSLKKGMKLYQMGVHKNLADVMHAINDDLVMLYDYVNIVAAMAFCFDFKERLLRYCPAAIPYVIIKRKNETRREKIFVKSSRVGYEQDTIFTEQIISLDDISEVIFLSDGLSDLLLDDDGDFLETAKHDDVSMIFVKLNF